MKGWDNGVPSEEAMKNVALLLAATILVMGCGSNSEQPMAKVDMPSSNLNMSLSATSHRIAALGGA